MRGSARSLLFVCLYSCIQGMYGKGHEVSFTILHFNDFHGRLEETSAWPGQLGGCNDGQCAGGLPRMASFIRHVRQTAGKPVLLLDAGDNIIGTRWDSWYRGKATAHFLNQLKIDAMTLGNHEFDYGADSLLEYLNKMDHPALCCNMNPNGHGLGNRVRRSVVKEVGGVKVGIVGLTTRYTNEGSRPWPAQITREHVAARECIKQLKQQGVQIIIALSHLGYNADKWLAQQVADIDIVIGGHAHAFLWSGSQAPVLRKNNGKDVRDSAVGPYPTWVRSRVQPWRRIIVLQAFWASRYVGKLDVKFNQDGELAWAQGKPHLMGGPGSSSVVQPDWAMKRSIQTWKKW